MRLRIQCRAWFLCYLLFEFLVSMDSPLLFIVCNAFNGNLFSLHRRIYCFFFYVSHTQNQMPLNVKCYLFSTISRTHIQSTTLSQVLELNWVLEKRFDCCSVKCIHVLINQTIYDDSSFTGKYRLFFVKCFLIPPHIMES